MTIGTGANTLSNDGSICCQVAEQIMDCRKNNALLMCSR